MVNIYQLFPRLFGNTSGQQRYNGTIQENGCGKFSGINRQAIEALRELGITHIWLTGIIRHATLSDYSAHGIPLSHPSLVKGRAGSPYAINDYYDVDPDLAEDVDARMEEFQALLQRIKQADLKTIIDFVPNHVARQYHSVAKPKNIRDLGQDDNPQFGFRPDNNFYYLTNHTFIPPEREDDIYQSSTVYVEQPAKVTGNDCFSPTPSLNDWFETVKLNYGVDYFGFMNQHFDPIPDTWHKMLHILHFWANKGVDGFRVDMAEMVPIAFWQWSIAQLKKDFPDLIMIAEVYIPGRYGDFIAAGFDYLYDKVSLYDRLIDILIHGHPAHGLTACWQNTEGINNKMLRFLENHDEIRLASWQTGLQLHMTLPALAVSAFMHPCGLMIYNGQESGEQALGATGFSADDGRTSIYDYCVMRQHQQWYNFGKCDGGMLNYDQQLLRKAIGEILNARKNLPALRCGAFYDLMWANPWFTNFDPQYVYAFARYTKGQNLVIVANFNKVEWRKVLLKIPEDALALMGFATAKLPILRLELIAGNGHCQAEIDGRSFALDGCPIKIPPSNFAIFELITPS